VRTSLRSNREKTGNFAESDQPSQFLGPIRAPIQSLTAGFPTKQNREFSNAYQGMFSRNSEFLAGRREMPFDFDWVAATYRKLK
jgi:hypothetical protein